MKRSKTKNLVIAILIVLMLLFIFVTFKAAKAAYDRKVEKEDFSNPDFYSMQEFSTENSLLVMNALKTGKTDKLEEFMADAGGLADVAAFADWKEADFENAVSLGAGSLTQAPDAQGKMDISERFIVDIGEEKYVIFIETMTSRYGMKNEGVSAIAVTTYSHFDDLDYGWNGEKDDSSVLAGELFWNKTE